MATVYFRGDAPAVAQVQTYLFGGTWEADDLIRVTIGGKTVDFVAGDTVIADILDAIVTAWEALDSDQYPEFAEITPTRDTATLVLTAATAGKPFVCSMITLEVNEDPADAQTIEGAGTATTGTADTASAGPNHWDTAANWSGGAIPANDDIVVVDLEDADIKYGLAQSGVTPDALIVRGNAKIGLPRVNRDGADYLEYRSNYLVISPDVTTIEGPTDRCNLNTEAVQTILNVWDSGTGEDADTPAILWKGTHAANVVNINKGIVGVAIYPGETATIATLRVGYRDNIESDANVQCGSGTTLTDISKSGGVLLVDSATTTFVQTAGTATLRAGAHASVIADGGTVYYQSASTLTTGKAGSDGVLDFSRDMRPRTVTNCEVHQRGSIRDPFQTVAWTNGIDLIRCSPSEVTLDIGTHLTLTPSAI